MTIPDHYLQGCDNVYVNLTGKGLRPDIMVMKRIQAVRSRIRQGLELVVATMKKKNGIMGLDPNSGSVIKVEAYLIALGNADSLRCMEEFPG